jgi:hypothetical protein
VRCSISFSSSKAIPPRRTWPKESSVSAAVAAAPPSERVAPSATTTIENVLPVVSWRWRMCSQTSSTSNGRSGTRMTSAPPAMPDHVAIQPASRPMTSQTITRSCDSAVECSRSIASVAICTAV